MGGAQDRYTAEYDGGGTRVRSRHNGVDHTYSYGAGVLHDSAGNTVYTPGVSERRNGADRYYHEDWLGSTRYLTDGTGNAAPTANRYDAYGNTSAQAGPDATSVKFAGGHGYESDGPMGLQLLGARYYDPEIGRFINPDPIGYAGGMNLYGYCGGNPVGLVDPSGLMGSGALRKGDYQALDRFNGGPAKEWIDRNVVSNPWVMGAVGGGRGVPGGPAGIVAGATLFAATAEYAGTRDVPKAIGKGAEVGSVAVVAASATSALAGCGGGGVLKLQQRWGPYTGQGPLDMETIKNFRSGSYTERVLLQDTILYRVYGGAASAQGRWLSRTPPRGVLQTRIDLALKPEWNSVEGVAVYRVPAGTVIYEGAAAPQGGMLLGGGNQVFIKNVDPKWRVK